MPILHSPQLLSTRLSFSVVVFCAYPMDRRPCIGS
jgi:hypothetical protein